MTVWAEEQEDSRKLAKWQPIPAPGQSAAKAGANGPVDDVNDGLASTSENQSAAAGASKLGRRFGSDYLVPWHVPSYRPEAAAVAAAATRDPHAVSGCDSGPASTSGSNAAHGVASGMVDTQKGTVVFQRYYHLFCKGELEQLAAPLPGVGSVKTFYDKDNWCLVMEKMQMP